MSAACGDGASPAEHEWPPSPSNVQLRPDEVHVWRASLDRDANACAEFFAVLAEDERERAQRFRFERDRVRYVVARGLLRDILGRLVRRPPSSLRFTYNGYGKPSLADEGDGLRFNLAHSEGLGVYACALGREVGVDVEMWRDDFASMDVARRFFSAAEVQTLGSLPPHLLTRSFFNCWTRKEAYIKALGAGLSHPLDSFAVTLAPGKPARLVSTDGDPAEAARWSIFDLKPFKGCSAALAVRGGDARLCCWDWRPADEVTGG